MADVTAILDKLEDLPALPTSATRIITALNGDEIDVKEVEQIVRCDEAVSAAVLRWANSVQYGRPGRIFSLKESINRLGRKTLLKIALQENVTAVIENAGSAYGLRRGALRRGALAGALIAEEIASHTGFEDPDLCFLCALLRDIGKLAIDLLDGDGSALTSGAVVEDESYLEMERRLFGADHASIGAEMARRWNLPDRIADAIHYHHGPPANEDPGHDTLIDIVHAADVICLWSGLATGFDGLSYPLADHVRTGILRKRSQAETYISEMWGRLKELEDEMGEPPAEEKSA